ncbi:SctK family type III secretion system sorting platform protein [Pseudomonas sp. MWU13-3659]|uniref:SctK family type III secretion system sorting platform protein n=1 Tax=Pseudomonas sp. MWU13-3659 TaxID=2986964 RepID=UPI00256EC718|nr:SctK family type III secretion system sorting platform protein [Pseudomonas sp. MWU13-3659]
MELPLTFFQFRYCPARYLHAEHLPAALRQVVHALPHWRQDSTINGWLLGELELREGFDSPAQMGGLGLFEQPALEATLGALGGLLHGQAIQRLVDQASLERVLRALGEDGHRFCLEKWRLIIGQWPAGWQRELPPGELEGYLLGCGLAFWLAACGDVAAGFARRLALRLASAPAPPAWSMNDEQLKLARTLCLKVARERSPACFHLLK